MDFPEVLTVFFHNLIFQSLSKCVLQILSVGFRFFFLEWWDFTKKRFGFYISEHCCCQFAAGHALLFADRQFSTLSQKGTSIYISDLFWDSRRNSTRYKLFKLLRHLFAWRILKICQRTVPSLIFFCS